MFVYGVLSFQAKIANYPGTAMDVKPIRFSRFRMLLPCCEAQSFFQRLSVGKYSRISVTDSSKV